MISFVRLIFSIAFSIGFLSVGSAQIDCSQSLLQAEGAYATGRFNEVESLLDACIKSGFNKEQKFQGYKLIALSSIFSKNFQHADSALIFMLRANPQYEFAAQDPPEFRRRVEGFNVHPLIEFTASLGAIQPVPEISEVYNARVIGTRASYRGKLGSHGGLNAALYLSQRFSVRLGYEFQRYSFIMEDQNTLSTGNLTESQSRRQWQAAVGYKFYFNRANLQVYGGVVYSTLTKADATFVIRREDGSDEIVYFSNLSNRTAKELRPLAELKFNVPSKSKFVLSLSLRYELGLENLTNSSNRSADLNRMASLEWVEDDFKASYLVATIGFSKLFYRIKAKANKDKVQ